MTLNQLPTQNYFRRLALPLIAVLWVWHAVLLVSWLSRDTRPPRWDQSVHLSTAWDYRDALLSLEFSDLLKVRPRPGHPVYPPLVHYLMVPAMLIGDVAGIPPEDAAPMVNLLFIFVLSIAAYFLASAFWGPAGGVSAAFLVTLLPPVVLFSREALVDVSLAAWVLMSYACWVRSESFSRRQWCVMLGLSVGAGMLSKWSFPFYVIPIFFDVVWQFWQAEEESSRRSILLGIGIAIVLFLPWYSVNAIKVLPRVLSSANIGGAEGDPSFRTLAGWMWYPQMALARTHLVWIIAGLLGYAAILFRQKRGGAVLSLWFISGYLFWTFVSNKNDRYLLPFLTPLAVAVAALPWRLPLISSLAAVGFSAWITWAPAGKVYADPPRAEIWPLEAIINRVDDLRDSSAALSLMTVVVNHDYMNGSNLAWIVQKLGKEDRIVPRGKLKRLGEFSEFVLLKTGSLGPEYASGRQWRAREEALASGSWFQQHFSLAERWTLPDGTQALLFQRGNPMESKQGQNPAEVFPSLFPGVVLGGMKAKAVADGVYEISAATVSLKGVTLTDLRVRLEGFLAVRADDGTSRLLRLRRLVVQRANLSAESLTEFLVKKATFLEDARVTFRRHNGLDIRGKIGSFPIELGGTIRYDSGKSTPMLSFRLERLRIARVRVPLFALGGLRVKTFLMGGSRGMPFVLMLDNLSTEPAGANSGGVLRIFEKNRVSAGDL